MSPKALRYLAIGVSVCLGMLGGVLLAAPEDLGISPVAARWLSILAVGLGILQGFLPNIQGTATDPSSLADRVWELPPDDREMVARLLSQRVEQEARVRTVRRDDPPPSPDYEGPAYLRRGRG